MVSIILVLSVLEFISLWRRHRASPIAPMSWFAVAVSAIAYFLLLATFASAFEWLGAAARGLS